MTSTPYTEDTLVQQTIAEKKFEDRSVKGKVWDRICRNRHSSFARRIVKLNPRQTTSGSND